MTTYKEIFGKPIKVLTGDPAPTPITYTVTVSNPGSGNVYYIDGVQQKQLELYEGNTYNFDYSAASSHPFRFSTTSDGTHNSGSEYTTGVSVDSNITTIVVASGAPNLFYYCSSHSGMGGTALTPASPSEYEGQIWYNETTGKFRSVVAGGAFSSSAPLATPRNSAASFGTQTAGVIGLGGTPPGGNSNATEEYSGSSWSTGNNANTARRYLTGFGIESAGVACGGYITAASAASEEYNGSSWSSGNSLNTARHFLAGAGILTAGVAFGGNASPFTAATEEYDGTNWTNVNSMSTARGYLGGTGVQTAALAIGGYTGSNTAATEEYDGTNWTAGGSLNTARRNASGGGTQTDGQAFGGGGPSSTTAFEQYNGTTWSTSPLTLATARQSAGSLGQPGSQTANLITGGSGATSVTEEFNFTANTVIQAAWSSGGNYPTNVQGMGAAGTQTATVTAGGAGPINTACEYNGSSWTNITNYPISLRDVTGTGVQTAGFMISGYSPGNTEKTNYWNGSSWSAGGDLNNSTNRQLGGSAGVLTAALYWGGDGGTPITAFESYNGSAWTALTAAPFGGNSSGCGTSTAALATPGPSVNTYEWGGSSWTAGGNMAQQHEYGNVTGTQTDALQYGGGTPGSPAAYTNSTEGYDGTTWSTRPGMATARAIHGHGTQGTSTAALATAGYYPGASPAALNATEEFNGGTTTLNYKNISSS